MRFPVTCTRCNQKLIPSFFEANCDTKIARKQMDFHFNFDFIFSSPSRNCKANTGYVDTSLIDDMNINNSDANGIFQELLWLCCQLTSSVDCENFHRFKHVVEWFDFLFK